MGLLESTSPGSHSLDADTTRAVGIEGSCADPPSPPTRAVRIAKATSRHDLVTEFVLICVAAPY
jgi:hypothetical protein